MLPSDSSSASQRPLDCNQREGLRKSAGFRRERYPKHHPVPGPRMAVDGADLGAAMLPNDVLIELRGSAGLDHDEIIQALHAAADRVERDIGRGAKAQIDGSPRKPQSRANPPGISLHSRALGMLPVAERLAAIAAARAVTRSRIDAWRRRHRQMTWPELRMLLIGLRGTL